jgi:hypothetical protein
VRCDCSPLAQGAASVILRDCAEIGDGAIAGTPFTTEAQRGLAPLARNRRSWVGPLAPRRGEPNLADRTSAGRGDARGVGYRGSSYFLGIELFFASNATPLPFIPSPRADQFRRSLVGKHGARGPIVLPFVQEKSSRAAQKLRPSSTENTEDTQRKAWKVC